MDIAAFHAGRRFAEIKSGRIAYFEQGQGPVALFIHGVPLNGYHWRHIIASLKHRRRCIAIDLMGLGFTEIASTQDVSFTAQAQMIAEVLDSLAIDKVDLIANDSGGAIAQIFAARHPHRLTSLVLTNCDVHDGWPPPQVLPLMELSRKGEIAKVFGPTAERPDLARERYARGESVPLFRSYADPSILTDELIRLLSAAAVLACADRRVPALLARLRQQAHGRHPRCVEDAAGADPDRVGPEGHLLRRQMGVLAEGYHSRRQARYRGSGRAAVLPGGSP
jgi:pimeloyl-ACP methyl ester carboxylesterase